MHLRLSLLGTTALLLAMAVFPAQDPGGAPTPSSTIPHVVPGVSPNRTPTDFYVFSWAEFYALNWPAKITSGQPERGVPDPGKTMGDVNGPRVWETWKADYELFPNQAKGAVTPTPWSSWEVAGGAPCKAGSQVRTLPFIAKGESLIPGGVNQAMGGPLVDQQQDYVRYEVRVNQSEYDKIVQKNWFLRKNLSRYPQPPNLLDASSVDSYGAIEIKAAWRIIRDDEKPEVRSRYYTIQATLVDPQTGDCSPKPVTMGLVGLHIAHKTREFAAWVWSTFEQVDNVPRDGELKCALGCSFYDGGNPDTPLKSWGFSPALAYRPQDPKSLKPDGAAARVRVLRLNPLRPDIVTLNQQVHERPQIKGTVWENYELVEAQWQTAFPTPIKISNDRTSEDLYPQLVGFPTDAVANTSMESFFQGFKGTPADPARNRIGIPSFGSSCLHCHYTAAQYDFSWMLADQAWPSSPGAEGTTKADLKAKSPH